MKYTKANLKKNLNELNIPVTPDGYVKSKHIKWALRKLVKSDLIPKKDLKRAESLEPGDKRELLKMVYQTILTGLGREREMPVFERAIKMIPDREVEQEFRAVMDGTVSKIVKTMLRNDLSQEEMEELGAIYEGLAGPYFRNYKGDVPQEDLEWAHKQISDYFEKVSDKQPQTKIGDRKRNNQKRID